MRSTPGGSRDREQVLPPALDRRPGQLKTSVSGQVSNVMIAAFCDFRQNLAFFLKKTMSRLQTYIGSGTFVRIWFV
jgi:hypothetical protein